MWYAVAGIIIVIGVAIAAVLVYRRHKDKVDPLIKKGEDIIRKV